jgi:hypothetical protein
MADAGNLPRVTVLFTGLSGWSFSSSRVKATSSFVNSEWALADESGGGPPQSKMLARFPVTSEPREASWSAPALWRFSSAMRRYNVQNIQRPAALGDGNFF